MQEIKKEFFQIAEIFLWIMLEVGLAYLTTKIEWMPKEALLPLSATYIIVGKIIVKRAKKYYVYSSKDLKE